jgi:hypothetical protein
METVTIRHQGQYSMPKICCACGSSAESGKLMISGSSRGLVRFVNLSFPLCNPCAHLSQAINRRRKMARWIGLSIVLFLTIGVIAVSYASAAIPDISLFTLLGGLMPLAPFIVLEIWAAQWLASNIGLNREARQAFRRVLKAVKIKRYDVNVLGDGHITFEFINERFADLFQEMNTGVVLPGKVVLKDTHIK